MRSASRSLFVLAAALVFPVFASAQASSGAAQAIKPVAKPSATAAMKPPAPATVARPSAATPTAASAAATTAAPPVAKKAGPARDANGRFIAKSAAPAAAGAAVTATCKDGSTWNGKQRAGACARHGGVKAFN